MNSDYNNTKEKIKNQNNKIELIKDSNLGNSKINNNLLNHSNNHYSYKPSEYKSLLINNQLSENDKLLLEKYNNINYNNYKFDNKNINNHLDNINKFSYNYQIFDNPKSSSISYINKNNINDKKYLLNPNEYINTKTYLERNNLKVNDIAKDKNINLYDNEINDEKIYKNKPYPMKKSYSYQSFIKNNNPIYSSNDNNINNNNNNFNLNYSYNISKLYPTQTLNIAQNTTLENYHIPHTQSSLRKKSNYEYSPFNFQRHRTNNNYNNISSFLSNDNNTNTNHYLNKINSNQYRLYSSDIKNNNILNYYQNQTLFKNNININEDIIRKNKYKGAKKDDLNEILISSSPTDYYYNTLHKEFVPKTQNIPIQFKSFLTYEIDSKNDYKSKNNMINHSKIMSDLINRNKNN